MNKLEIKRYMKEYFQRPKVKAKMRKYRKEYYNKNRKKILKRTKEYRARPENRLKQKEYNKEYNKEYYPKNKERLLKQQREYSERPESKTRKKEWEKEYYQKPEVKEKLKEYMKKYMKEYYKKNTEKFKGYVKKYQTSKKGKKKIKEYKEEYLQRPETIKHRREYYKKRMLDDSNRLKKHFLVCFRRVLNKYHQTGKFKSRRENKMAYDYIGVDFNKIIEKLEPLPKNLKEYQVDHIIPQNKFDFTKKEDIKKAWSPENIRLITIEENLKKNKFLLKNNFI